MTLSNWLVQEKIELYFLECYFADWYLIQLDDWQYHCRRLNMSQPFPFFDQERLFSIFLRCCLGHLIIPNYEQNMHPPTENRHTDIWHTRWFYCFSAGTNLSYNPDGWLSRTLTTDQSALNTSYQICLPILSTYSVRGTGWSVKPYTQFLSMSFTNPRCL